MSAEEVAKELKSVDDYLESVLKILNTYLDKPCKSPHDAALLIDNKYKSLFLKIEVLKTIVDANYHRTPTLVIKAVRSLYENY